MPPLQRDPPILQELCTLLVNDQYGELASKVFSVLCRTGRTTLAGVVRASYLNGKQIKHGLVSLIQQHLIFHYAADPRVTYYEIDWQQAYSLLRYGRMASMIESRYGPKVANILLNLVTYGHARIEDLNNAYFPPPESNTGNESDDGQANGNTSGKGKVNGINGSAKINGVNGTSKEFPNELRDDESPVKLLAHGDAPATNGDAHAVNGDAPPTNGDAPLANGDGPLVNGDGNVGGAVKEATDAKGPTSKGKGKSAKGKEIANEVEPEHEVSDAEESENNIRSIAELHDLIYLLILNGWIVPVQPNHYLSPGDIHEIALQEILDGQHQGQMPTGTKDKEALVGSVAARKRLIREESLAMETPKTRKRKREDRELDRPSKRLRIMGVEKWSSSKTSNYQDRDTVPELDLNLVVRVNMEKLSVAMRTEHLVRLVERRLCRVTAKIYEAMLWALEFNQQRCYEPWPDPPAAPEPGIAAYVDPGLLITAKDIMKVLPRNLDLCEGIDPDFIVKLIPGHRVTSKGFIEPPIKLYDLSIKEKLELIEKHIWQLSFDPFNFVTWHSKRTGQCAEWHIEYDKIARIMIQNEIDNTVAKKTDVLGVKLVRALKKKGRCDELEMCEAMMMNSNDIRPLVCDLAMKGIVQTQEIPKVDRREAKLSWHLAWFDLQRTREKLLHDTYKGMVRLMQRLNYEKERVKDLLAKAERSDVVGNEDKYLSPGEREALQKFQKVEEALWVQLGREDELVAVLRDFTGPFVSV